MPTPEQHPHQHRQLTVNTKNVVAALLILLVVILIPGRIALNKRHTYLEQAGLDNAQTQVITAQVVQGRIVEKHLAVYQKELKTYQTAVPPVYSLPGLVHALTNLALATGVIWMSGAPTQPVAVTTTTTLPVVGATTTTVLAGVPVTTPEPAGVPSYPIQVTVSGTAAQIANYIRLVQAQPQMFTITNASVSYTAPTGHSNLPAGNNLSQSTAQIDLLSYV